MTAGDRWMTDIRRKMTSGMVRFDCEDETGQSVQQTVALKSLWVQSVIARVCRDMADDWLFK